MAGADKWDTVDHDLWAGGLPVLRGCLASFACRREALYEGGDHVIIVGRVEQLAIDGDGDPLIYFRSDYRSAGRSEEHTSELQSLMRISYAVFCLKKKK